MTGSEPTNVKQARDSLCKAGKVRAGSKGESGVSGCGGGGLTSSGNHGVGSASTAAERGPSTSGAESGLVWAGSSKMGVGSANDAAGMRSGVRGAPIAIGASPGAVAGATEGVASGSGCSVLRTGARACVLVSAGTAAA